MSRKEEALGAMSQHFEKTPEGHTRWVSSRELHARGLISDEEWARRLAILEDVARDLEAERGDG